MELTESGKLPQDYIDRLDSLFALNYARANEYYRYTIGNNPGIIDKPAQSAPDNRVPVAIGRKIVKTVKGYMAKAGYITYKAEGEDYQEELKDIFDSNDEELLTAELFGDCIGNVAGYEILRVNEGLEIKQYRCKPEYGMPVYGDTIDEPLIAFIHRTSYEQADGTTEYRQTIYYDNYFEEYKRYGDQLWTLVDRKDHPFGEVPVIVYHCSEDKLPIFASVIPKINELDKIISADYANEMERFANAYLLALKKISAEVAAKSKELKIFDDLESGGVDGVKDVTQAIAFLTKPSRGEDIAEAADRFERLIYDMAMVVNPNDLKTGTAITGIAYRLKVLPMEWLCSDIEAYFSRGLQRRIVLVGNAVQFLYKIAPEMVTIHFRRNIPVDIDSIVETAQKAKGVLSEKTILDFFPGDIVPDKAAEQERLDEERAERLPIFSAEAE